MSGEEMRARLARALEEARGPSYEVWADNLLPVVRAIAAEELRAAAQEAVDSGYILRLDGGQMFDVLTAEQIRERADALEAAR